MCLRRDIHKRNGVKKMDLQEAQEVLNQSSITWRYEIPPHNQPRIFIGKDEQEIVFTERGAFIKYRKHDNCSKCGSPTNFEVKAKEISKKELKTMVQNHRLKAVKE